MKLENAVEVRRALEYLAGNSRDNVVIDFRERAAIEAIDPEQELWVIESFDWMEELVSEWHIKRVDGVNLFRRWTRQSWDIVCHHNAVRKERLKAKEELIKVREEEEAKAKAAREEVMINRVVALMVELGQTEENARKKLGKMEEGKKLEFVAQMLALEEMDVEGEE